MKAPVVVASSSHLLLVCADVCSWRIYELCLTPQQQGDRAFVGASHFKTAGNTGGQAGWQAAVAKHRHPNGHINWSWTNSIVFSQN